VNSKLVIAGVVLVVVGLLWSWLVQFPFGRLPGDLRLARGSFVLYLPITTGLVLSLVISLLLWLIRR
jgi:predicted acyltransferase